MAVRQRDLDASSVLGVFDTLTKAGVSKADAAEIAGHWVIAQAGKDKRTFAYTAALAATAPVCAAKFTRGFAHVDWIDGESVVQAEDTSIEEGFNKRFHAIEKDLDALGVDVKQAFACLADLRVALQKILDEIKLELNRINADIHECCHEERTFVPWAPNQSFAENRFLGFADIYGRQMQLWQTGQGTFVLPTPPKGGDEPWNDPRAKRVEELARVLTDDREILNFFKNTPTVEKDDFSRRFGDKRSPGGIPVKDLVDILPKGSRFKSADEMMAAVSEREAAAIRTSGLREVMITSAFGLGANVTTLADAPLEDYGGLTKGQRTALVAAGITTLGKLGSADPKTIANALKSGGVGATAGDVNAMKMRAQTLMKTK